MQNGEWIGAQKEQMWEEVFNSPVIDDGGLNWTVKTDQSDWT